MNRVRLFLVVFVLFGASGVISAQNETPEKFVFLEAGFYVQDEYEEVHSRVDKRWNIQHKLVAGCMVSSRLEDSIATYNRETLLKLERAYGKDWQRRYQAEIAEATRLHKEVLDKAMIFELTNENENLIETVCHTWNLSRLSVLITSKDSTSRRTARPFDSQGQVAVIQNLQDVANDVIYRGFSNLFEIKFEENSDPTEYFLECTNCAISKINNGDSLAIHNYVIRPGSGKIAELQVRTPDDRSAIFHFVVSNLPDPELWMNGVPSGGKLDVSKLDSTLQLELRYPVVVSLRNEYTIINWEAQCGEKGLIRAGGTGDQIPPAFIKSIKELKTGSRISVMTTVSGPDGIFRKKVGVFIFENE